MIWLIVGAIVAVLGATVVVTNITLDADPWINH